MLSLPSRWDFVLRLAAFRPALSPHLVFRLGVVLNRVDTAKVFAGVAAPCGGDKDRVTKTPPKKLQFCGNSCQTSMFNYWPVLLPEPPLAEVPQPMQPEPNPEPSPEPDPEPMDPDVADPVPEWESSCSCSKMSSRSQDDEFPSLWAPSPGDST